MGLVFGCNAAVSIQELIGVRNPGLYLEARCSYVFVPKLQAVQWVHCKSQGLIPWPFWVELVGIDDAVVFLAFGV